MTKSSYAHASSPPTTKDSTTTAAMPDSTDSAFSAFTLDSSQPRQLSAASSVITAPCLSSLDDHRL